MKNIQLHNASPNINGEITLPGSKSIANRALIIRALCDGGFNIDNLSSAKDTQTLIQLLNSEEKILDAGPAGTTFRFLTAYLATQKDTNILTGSERMKQRPIGVLADALNGIGANIKYLEKEGYPPLEIGSSDNLGTPAEIHLAADISSQYISALLMIAPTLPKGLKINFQGTPVSIPYILMTLRMMEYFGVSHDFSNNAIQVNSGNYSGKEFKVEADWSAASYYYGLAALAEEADIRVNGLFEKSLQGDSVIAKIGKLFGLQTFYDENGIRIVKIKNNPVSFFEYDFTECPDIAQTVAVICGGLGIPAKFTGLKTLRIKETDRITALKNELAKVGVGVRPIKLGDDWGMEISGQAKVASPTFETYEDHRMAMAFAPLGLLGNIIIEEPEVVGKSYPDFWEDMKVMGFDTKII